MIQTSYFFFIKDDLKSKRIYIISFIVLFKKSLNKEIFPPFLKFSIITPILKSGDLSKVKNYRPIINIPHIEKLFKTLILNFIKSCNSVLTSHIFDYFRQYSRVVMIYND